ncbi:hypothetical protein BG015_011560 [Linnemannia schmuckeri]|uniref:Uncharacterized protein n=1 Tax=Linnemannia schmuckeri TaxID=64567 RepID=A0A9P5V8A4_9FUNG|nr:hypothetical protein BG015_011560 [Linnemannia schmuckeri]
MLAPTSNTTTPGSSTDALVHSRSVSSRAPQEANYQIDDDSRASAVVASSPQYIDENAVPSTNSPYMTSSVIRNPHAQPSENSPSVSHPQAYSPALSSSYIPPPSPTPSQSNAYPVPEGTYSKIAFSNPDGTYQQHHQQQQHYQQNMFQNPYQQTYQQAYPEPIVHSYPEPALVDTFTSASEKPKSTFSGSVTKSTNSGRRKKIIWIGSFVILILIGAIIGIVVSMKNKDSDKNSDNATSRGGSSKTSPSTSTPTTFSGIRPVPSVPVTVPSTPVTVSSAPVTVPTPTGGSSGSVVTPKPLPPLPEKGQCPTFFCDEWFWDCRDNVCSNDGNYKAYRFD